ncbi:MAG: hypothetical protein FWB95_01805 [Treponema sp.]|nr:hypothetical protein [Treponema sp.]
MGFKKLISVLSLFTLIAAALFFSLSCKTTSEAVKTDTGTGQTTAAGNTAQQGDIFDPTKISQQYYDTTRDEVRRFIEALNRIIRERKFEDWKANLSSEYFAEISSAENLRNLSEQPAMKTRRITLKTAQDYFDYVVVPSRANLRVDDIEFISMNRVKAFTNTKNSAGEDISLRLYDLEKINDSWTIIN